MSYLSDIKIRTIVLIFLVITQASLHGIDRTLARRLPPEHADVRTQFIDYVDAPLVELFRLREVQRQSRESLVNIRIWVEDNPTHVYLVTVPELDSEFPVYSAGSYILRRRRDNGQINQLKIFLRSDPGFFVRIQPEREDRSRMSVFVAGVEVYSGIPVPMGIPLLMETRLSRLLDVTDSFVDWEVFFPDIDSNDYRATEIMANRAREALHTLPDAEDGAMDENGNLVFIESLVLQDQQPGFNCSGFAKWIVDGLYMGRYGSFLSIEALKQKHLDLRGHQWSEPREDDRDPYFGLDWTRNLATAVLSAESGGVDVHPEAADVRQVEFARYIEDVGYPVSQIGQIMYSLAVAEPGRFYLASLNREFGSQPRLNQHVHVAVLFPYFTPDGTFRTVVLERNVESSIDSLLSRYENDHIHLVRIEAHGSYSPPVIRN